MVDSYFTDNAAQGGANGINAIESSIHATGISGL